MLAGKIRGQWLGIPAGQPEKKSSHKAHQCFQKFSFMTGAIRSMGL
jgi:hypothetical protein